MALNDNHIHENGSILHSKLTHNVIDPTPENLEKFASIISSAFHSTPLTTIFIAEIDGAAAANVTNDGSAAASATSGTGHDPTTIPTTSKPSPSALTPPFTHSRRVAHFHPGIVSAAQSGAILVEAGNWSAIALWEPPNFQGKPFAEVKEKPLPIMNDWRTSVRRMKATHLYDPELYTSSPVAAQALRVEDVQLRPYWHLSFLARNPSDPANPYSTPQVPGAIGAVLQPFLTQAREALVPVWLEATSPHAVGIYEHFGFRLCEEVVVGGGRCNRNGWPVGEGESGEMIDAGGARAWGMIYDAHLR